MLVRATETAKILAAVQKFYKEKLFISRGKKMPATVDKVFEGYAYGVTAGGKDYQQNLGVCGLCVDH